MKMILPLNGRVSSKFGNRIHPITGKTSFHNGIDIAAPSGTPIISPADGKVTQRYFHKSGGNSLIIKHDNGFTTGYAHLLKFSVNLGDIVKQGQKIGEVGSTGASTGPHLHLTVRNASGELLDPEKVFKLS